MEMITNVVLGHRVQVMQMTLVKSFINTIHRGATASNILTGFRTSGISPLNQLKHLSSPFAVERQQEGIHQNVNMGAEINKMVLRWPSVLEKLAQIEYGQSFPRMDAEINSGLIWDQLLEKIVTQRVL
jgi:hypothetical protein